MPSAGMQELVGLQYGSSRTFSADYWANGSLGAPGGAFNTDRNSGVRLVSPDYWAIVAGGQDAIRITGLAADTPFGPRIGIGNVGEPGATDNPENLFHVHYSGSANSNGVVGIVTSITDNAEDVRSAPSVIPDLSGITAIIAQTTDAANGAGRAAEIHAIRAASASLGGTWMGIELGVHTGTAGNATFGTTGGGDPLTVGIFGRSYQDSVMAALAVPAVVIDCMYYAGGAAGIRFPFFYHDASNNVDFFVNQAGNVRVTTDNNEAAVGYGFVGREDDGMFSAGAGAVALAAGGIEAVRAYSLSASHAAFQVGYGLNLGGRINPAQLTANQNNWIPIDAVSGDSLGKASIIRVTTDASRTVTGLLATEDGAVVAICNAGANNLVLAHNDTGNSTAANCFVLPNSANLTLLPNMSVILFYDGTSGRWRCLSGFVS